MSMHPCLRRPLVVLVLLLFIGALPGAAFVEAQEKPLGAKELGDKQLGAILWGKGKELHGQIHFGEPITEHGTLWAVTTTNRITKEHWIPGVAPTPLVYYLRMKAGIDCRVLKERSKVHPGNVQVPVEISLASGQLLSIPFLLFYGKQEIRLNSQEQDNLRAYLVNQKGFLIVDEARDVPGMEDGRFLASLKEVLGHILSEYPIVPIPDDHEIYHSYYELPGPPRGHAQGRGALEGIFVDRRLVVVFSDRSYCTLWAHTASQEEYIPEVFQFGFNVILYAVTHGDIADYSGYMR